MATKDQLNKKIAALEATTFKTKSELYKFITSQMRRIVKEGMTLDSMDDEFMDSDDEVLMGIDFRKDIGKKAGSRDFIPDNACSVDVVIIGITWDEESDIPLVVYEQDGELSTEPITDEALTMDDLKEIMNIVDDWSNEGL